MSTLVGTVYYNICNTSQSCCLINFKSVTSKHSNPLVPGRTVVRAKHLQFDWKLNEVPDWPRPGQVSATVRFFVVVCLFTFFGECRRFGHQQ